MSLVKKDWHQNVMAALELVREKGGRTNFTAPVRISERGG